MSRLVVLSYGFRTFFLLAPVWAAVSLAAWVLMLGGHLAPPALSSAQWHAHEMLFGFTLAAAAGFFLTASTHWCNRPPLAGLPLAALAALWAAGRLAIYLWGLLPPLAVAAVDLAFPLVLGLSLSNTLLRHGQRREHLLPPVFLSFFVANLAFHAEWLGWLEGGAALGGRLFLAAVAFKIAVIAARIIPAFMEAWLPAHGRPDIRIRRSPVLESAARWAIVGFAIADVLAPQSPAVTMTAWAAAALNLLCLAGWQGWRCGRDPLMAVLHLGYFWVCAGLALKGLAAEGAGPVAALVHGLAAGAIGTWVLALMSRASLGHTGRPLKAAWWMVPAYGAVISGAVLRLAEGWAPASWSPALLAVSAAAWAAGFLIFLGGYGPWLMRPRVDGKPG